MQKNQLPFMIEENFINLIKSIYKIIANITLNSEKLIIFSLRLGPIHGFLLLPLLSNIKPNFQAFETRQKETRKSIFTKLLYSFNIFTFKIPARFFVDK